MIRCNNQIKKIYKEFLYLNSSLVLICCWDELSTTPSVFGFLGFAVVFGNIETVIPWIDHSIQETA